MLTQVKEFCRYQHRHQRYDQYSYMFHLELVVQVVLQFQHHIQIEHVLDVVYAAYGHDLLEDTETSIPQIKTLMGERATELIVAMTQPEGATRKERSTPEYYWRLSQTQYGSFLKLADRIANVYFGYTNVTLKVNDYTKSQRRLNTYRNEMPKLYQNLGHEQEYLDMYAMLEKMLAE